MPYIKFYQLYISNPTILLAFQEAKKLGVESLTNEIEVLEVDI